MTGKFQAVCHYVQKLIFSLKKDYSIITPLSRDAVQLNFSPFLLLKARFCLFLLLLALPVRFNITPGTLVISQHKVGS